MADRRKPDPFDEVAAGEEAVRIMKEYLHALYDPVLEEPIPPRLLAVLRKFGSGR